MAASDPAAAPDPDDLARWHERAAIREYDGGEPRRPAELHAWTEVLDEIRERLAVRLRG